MCRVLAALLSAKYLHQEIREKGGAYGGGAVAGGGTFTYYSYRDPKNLETFSVYRNAAEWACKGSFTPQVPVACVAVAYLNRVVDPDLVRSGTFSWILNYLFRIRIQAKLKNR